jgi:multidrug transporter EmrE-like cation transporter
MPPGVLALLVAAAVLHAGWNILLKTSGDPLRTAERGMVVGAVVLVPAGLAGWLAVGRPPIPGEAWALALASGLIETVYFGLLSGAYARGDLSLVYPIARGTAPVLSVVVGILFLGERLGPLGAAGVALLLAGILSLQRPWTVLRRSGEMSRRTSEAIWLAVATGISITGYSAVDRVGARLVAPWLYAALIWTFTAVFLVGGIALVDRRQRRAAELALGSAAAVVGTETVEPLGVPAIDRSPLAGDPARGGGSRSVGAPAASGWLRAAMGGLVTVGAYMLVLVAYVFAPLAVVAPVRESAIVLVSGWGSFRLGEAATRRVAFTRLGAALVIVVGAFLLALET